MGPIIKFQLPKTIASPPPEIPKKEKKVLVQRWDLWSAINIGFDRSFVALAETTLRDNYSHRSDHDPFFGVAGSIKSPLSDR